MHHLWSPAAGLVPWAFSPRTGSVGTHVSAERPVERKEGVDGRVEPGQGDRRLCLGLQKQPISLNRTTVDLIRLSTCPQPRRLTLKEAWIAGPSPVMTTNGIPARNLLGAHGALLLYTVISYTVFRGKVKPTAGHY